MAEQLRRNRFTIIEMIWVIIVITIMMGLGATAMMSVGTHKGTEGGARMVARMVELTRQYAISENKRVALMMPVGKARYIAYTQMMPDDSVDISKESSDPLDGAAVDTDQAGIIMRPAIVRGSGSSYTFVEWVDDSKWEMIPQSVFFSFDDTLVDNSCIVDVTFTDTESKQVVTNGTQKGIVFKPNGALSGTDDVNIFVKPFNVGSNPTNYDPGEASVYQININWLTGKLTTTQWKKSGSWKAID